MLIRHAARSPQVHPSAYVAPNAVLCGDVTVGAGCRIMFGAQLIAEGGSIRLGQGCVVLENAVLRSTQTHDLRLGDHCLVGPQAHVVGCSVEDEVFIATGASVFHGARLGKGSEVRINAVVHIKTELGAGTTVPIGWVAVGAPAQLFPPGEHEQIWEIQATLDFPRTVYGLSRVDASVRNITAVMSERLAAHADDVLIDEPDSV
jgi:carbonic anhydrase/acetyltransferase-like protein (isoleucine patch superfamily)